MLRESRQVGLKTIFNLAGQNRILLTLGLTFTLIPFLIAATLSMTITAINAGLPDVDYEQLNKNGKLTTAVITDIDTQTNVTINGEHPSIITYKYTGEDKEIEDRYRALDPDRINRMNVGDTIQVKYLANSSSIVGFEPFEFPFDVFFIILAPFLIIGLALLALLYLRVSRRLRLYQSADVKEAELVSMIPKHGSPIFGIGRGITVNYQYKTSKGENILAEDTTSDFSLLNSKKQGDLIKIFVSAEDESKSCLIPLLEQIRNNWKIE